ncbi:MAG: acyl-CoA dehydrogenase family protein [Syntrophaceae bacterium]|nr:acyl-CoA dehydrogenase family protein [Syntrophaceae bacterium]
MLQLDEEQRLILQSVREIVQKEIKPRAASLDETGEFPWDAVRIFSKNDILNPLLPRRYGGVEVSVPTFCMIVEEIAKACASSALLLITQAEGPWSIIYGANEFLKEKYLKRLAGDSQILTGFGAIEPSIGSNLFSLSTYAEVQGTHYLLQGEKCFVENGSVADFLVLYAYTDPSKGVQGISAFIIEKGSSGLVHLRDENRMGMRGTLYSEYLLENLAVPRENRIGEEGDGYLNMLYTLSASRLFTASQAVGIAQGAMEEALSYARRRVQFGKTITHHVPIQLMIAEMASGIESARLLTYKTAFLFDQGEAKKAGIYAAMAKLIASDTAMKVTTDAVQIMGGYGYMKDYPVERMMRDAKLTQIHTGTNQIMKLMIGRDLTGIS